MNCKGEGNYQEEDGYSRGMDNGTAEGEWWEEICDSIPTGMCTWRAITFGTRLILFSSGILFRL